MKNKKLIALSIMTIAVSCIFSACGFGKSGEEDQVVIVETPTPVPTIAPVATTTPVPQTTTYTSSDKSMSITLPDSTWSNKMDEGDMLSFESTTGDRILILHGKGEDAMSESVFPDTKDNAIALTATSDVIEGTDFEIQNYQAQKINGIDVYTYTVQYTNAEKGDGYTAIENCVIVGADEFYSIAGSVVTDNDLAGVQKSMKSFKILSDDSSLKAVTANTASSEDKTTEGETTAEDSTGSDNVDAVGEGSTTDEGTVDYSTTDTSYATEGTSYDGNGSSMDLYTEGGVAFNVYKDANGNWIDGDGNTFTFDADGTAYDQYGYAYNQGVSYSNSTSESYDDSYTYEDNGSTTADQNTSYSAGGNRELYTAGGVAFGIYQDENGNWIDGDGQTFTFDENGVAYDQYGNSYGN